MVLVVVAENNTGKRIMCEFILSTNRGRIIAADKRDKPLIRTMRDKNKSFLVCCFAALKR